jgi:hypothetical protein
MVLRCIKAEREAASLNTIGKPGNKLRVGLSPGFPTIGQAPPAA